MNLSKFNKLWVALTAAAGVLLFGLAPTETEAAFHLTTTEVYQVLVAFAGALGVYGVTNKK